ncbi:hypothetical protein NKG94_43740 [Micromonospora sp. M12]
MLRNLPLPRRRFTGTYSSIVCYRVGRRRLWLAALADPDSVDLGRSLTTAAAATRTDTPRLVLAVASSVGSWRPVGQVSLGAQLSAEEDAALAFDPVRNLPPDLRVAGPLAWLRDQTYRGRAGRAGDRSVRRLDRDNRLIRGTAFQHRVRSRVLIRRTQVRLGEDGLRLRLRVVAAHRRLLRQEVVCTGLDSVLIDLLVSHGSPVTPRPRPARDVRPASWDDRPGIRVRSGTLVR